ncbi:hypothetical protein GGS20DRAFT_588668 [Poronia punctata]|nr:hypothetical protein GGS20DRAFT_588668 [Poronia punctata]
MFLSWKPSSKGGWETLTKLPVGFDPVTAKRTGLQACSNCRARKVKCIWVVGGCERCISSGRECIYETTTSGSGKSSRRKSKGASTGAAATSSASASDQQQQTAEEAATTSSSSSPPATGKKARWSRKSSKQAEEGTSSAPPSEVPSDKSHDTAMSETTSTPISQDTTVTGDSSKMPSLVGSEMDMDVDDFMMPFMDSLGGNNMNLMGSSGATSPGSILENNYTTSDMGKRPACVTPSHLDMLAGVDSWEAFDTWESNGWVPTSLDISPIAAPTTAGPSSKALNLTNYGDEVDEDDEEEDDDDDGAACWCLRRLVVLVDEIESIVDGHDLMSLDGAMAAHKEALGRGAAMLQCAACTSRAENMMILAILVDKLVRVCRRVGEACAMGLNSNGERSMSRSSSTSDLRPGSSGTAPWLLLRGPPDTPAPGEDGRVYNVDAPDEYLFVVAGLLRFQLLQLYDLTQQLRHVAACTSSGPMSRRLGVCSKALREMLREAGLEPSGENELPSN